MIRVRQIKVLIERDNEKEWMNKISQKLKILEREIKSYQIIKKSIDARKKNSIFFVYEFDVEVCHEEKVLKRVGS